MSALPPPWKRIVERRLAEFVDRGMEMDKFRSVLDTGETPIMIISGGMGMGKTSLLMRMIHECALRKLPKAEVTCGKTNEDDYMGTMRKIRDDIGVEHFTPFTDLINYYTDPTYQPKLEVTLNVQTSGTISVASGMQVSQATTGDIAGVIVRDLMIVPQRSDLAVPMETRRTQLTQRFLEGLTAASSSSPVVLFFDDTEKMHNVTYKWMWEQIVGGVAVGAALQREGRALRRAPTPR